MEQCLDTRWETALRQTLSEVSPIVPLGEVVKHGGTISWKPGRCKMRHPTLGVMDIAVISNCPYLSERDGRALMDYIEEKNVKLDTMGMNFSWFLRRIGMGGAWWKSKSRRSKDQGFGRC